MSKTAVIFPGQGAQCVGMGRDVAQRSDRGRAVFRRATQILGFNIEAICFDGPAERLEQTDIQQPAIFVTSVALWEAFLEAGGRIDQFSFAAGLSLGEYTALHAAGALSFEDALELVQRRGRLMQEAATIHQGAMVSVIGGTEDSVLALCEQARQGDEVLAPANFNCPGQIVVSGSAGACDRAVALAEEYECRAVPLKVAGAFHSRLMESAAVGLRPVLERTTFTTPRIPVVANVDAGYHGSAPSIRDSLARQVIEPVLWQRCIERMMGDGVDEFVEMGPGRVLTGLMRRINRSF